MRETISLDGTWRGACGFVDPSDFSTFGGCLRAGMTEIPARVPGALETDLEAAGILPELYFGENILAVQDYETAAYCVSRSFRYERRAGFCDTLVFEGLDCFASVFIDGRRVGDFDNMLVPHRVPLTDLQDGEHELFVSFRPAVTEARKYEIAPSLFAQPYGYDALHVRKAPHMYGWDIMPRAVSCGIWRHVSIERVPVYHVKDIFAETLSVSQDGRRARVRLVWNTELGTADARHLTLHIEGRCGDSVFRLETALRHSGGMETLEVTDPMLWHPRGAGDPNLYQLTAELFLDGALVDTYETRVGIRTVKLERTSVTDEAGKGEFRFLINNRPVFVLGTNWVPVDAFHWRDEERLPAILPMLEDLGCNMVRCWGGNVYENDFFYDWCDAHGVMIWQDFAMACAVYPQDEDGDFARALREEVRAVVRRLRNHPALVLWAGDNECDCAYLWSGTGEDPNGNLPTRKIIPEVLKSLDRSRPYLPSSPYIDEEAFCTGKPTAEDHLWGPRDYFKGAYYRNSVCHFASETGYHGCPSPASLAKFIDADHLWPPLGDRQWLVHAATMDGREDSPYGYRIRLMWDQVETLFGKGTEATENLENFALASQISQAEAMKYFIERFRLSKWRRTGIIWWNLIDGWPQISDAVTDYYLEKKLAYFYIRRSQKPLCLMFDEPRDGRLALYAVNDGPRKRVFAYTLEDDAGQILLSGRERIAADSSRPIASLPAGEEKRFFLIRWKEEETGEEGLNHYFSNCVEIDFAFYKKLLAILEADR